MREEVGKLSVAHILIFPTLCKRCQKEFLTCSERIISATPAEGNIYDQPEPAWLIAVLDHYCHSIPIPDRHLADPICSPSLHPDQHPLHHTDQVDQEPVGVTNTFLWSPQMIDDPVLSGPLSPHALLQFLTTLSRLAPYPRLADVTHRAQLTWSRLLATLGRLQADCLVLQANLAEVKTTADRMQCQLNQIEASLSASLRAACLADACLEISDCLNQLYSTELAIILYSRQNQKALFSGGAFSTLSSSTTSSCSPIPGLPNKVPLHIHLATCSERIISATPAEGNIYDQPEPAWLIAVLDHYCHSIPIPDRHLADPICSPSLHPDQHPLHHTDQVDQVPVGVTNTFLWSPQMIDDPVLSGPLSPHALLQFLTTLSRLAPYPRLADVTHRAQLTWSRLLATLGRLQADCLVLQANLAEVKTTADRMQCQLNQIEASLSASLRAACLADACLEISDCLNQVCSGMC
ncbi:hypothetical protein AHF37_03119 [Paragonimus kellicotti]|nr:hypothetical protein AHF37_03119 [Paragonimus kellicotti]